MHRLLHILQILKEYFVLTFFVLISLLLLVSNDNPQLRSIRAYAIGFTGMLQNALSIIPNVFELQRENRVLRQLNVDLSDEVSRLREARLENMRLREMLSFRERSPLRLRPAEVVAKSLHLLQNTITLNIGEKDGVKLDMPVISYSGLVGRIVATSGRYSVGQILLNKDFRGSARIQRSRVDGILSWTGGEYLLLKNVAKKQDVIVGDAVVTSQYSNMFPPDIRIGTVIEVTEPAGSLFKELKIAPAADFTTLEQVFVVLTTPDMERDSLEHRRATR